MRLWFTPQGTVAACSGFSPGPVYSPRTSEPLHWKRPPRDKARKFPLPTPWGSHISFSKTTWRRPVLWEGWFFPQCLSYSPFFFFFVFFPVSFLSLFLFWLFPPLTRLVRSWVGSLLISICSFWTSDSDPTFASPKILILLPKMTHIHGSGGLEQFHSTIWRYKEQTPNLQYSWKADALSDLPLVSDVISCHFSQQLTVKSHRSEESSSNY